MVFDLVLGFLVLVVASYVGTTMALRAFFGRERYDSGESRSGGDRPRTDDDSPAGTDAGPADAESTDA